MLALKAHLPGHKIDGTIGVGGPLITVHFGATAYTATEDGAAARPLRSRCRRIRGAP